MLFSLAKQICGSLHPIRVIGEPLFGAHMVRYSYLKHVEMAEGVHPQSS